MDESSFILCRFVHWVRQFFKLDQSVWSGIARAKWQWMESEFLFLCLFTAACHVTPASANLISYVHSFTNLNLEWVKNKTIDFDRVSEFAT
jgi:hypothetical protein